MPSTNKTKKPAKKRPTDRNLTPDNLTPKQEQFCQEYIVDLNGTQAAIRAGYSAKTANEQAARLLANVSVKARVQELIAGRSKRTEINADWLLKRLADEVEADIGDLYDRETGALKPVHLWPDIWRKGLVAGVEVDQQYAYIDGDKVPDGVVTKIKLSDRLKRLELIGKHIDVGAFKEMIEHTGKNGGPIETITTEMDPKKASEIYKSLLSGRKSA